MLSGEKQRGLTKVSMRIGLREREKKSRGREREQKEVTILILTGSHIIYLPAKKYPLTVPRLDLHID